ncbi:hypothetical protein GMORB2_1977 [Geosmithia morbida]|uniref:Vacuolar protein 14 C-terminal Fig4-binding domain-containing protein n=1 Tax=Geosmithia morbida TaxID=1094350 RepID=A0A9P4YTN7_9HYPO|nr:uncharacterized protein GMORB2_1977 [Geosmithia morbida]KAF4121569.1 hypothetical protein GMORB2_1977 [Geosmithia morbida]
MDTNIQRALNDKLYDKRKAGALELERIIREATTDGNSEKVLCIIEQLCNDYAYAVNQPHARNGGLIGLAAAAIALGPVNSSPLLFIFFQLTTRRLTPCFLQDLPKYLSRIVPPVLACFTDQDARVRYYACEAMYNIAKVGKGEILIYFNSIFDQLCKLAADSELSVKNGAELLDRLVKDIVSESAASYVSVMELPSDYEGDDKASLFDDPAITLPTAFSLPRFIPLLRERICVINPFTRNFLVGWLTLLDSIPDLELVTYLPDFLGGLLKFLGDQTADVRASTQTCLDKFLSEIKRISRVKKGILDSKKQRDGGKRKRQDSADSGSGRAPLEEGDELDSDAILDDDPDDLDEDWIPGQDVEINYKEILEILTSTLDSPLEEDCLLESLRWIVEFLEICPEEVLPSTPKILSHMLPAMASPNETIHLAATRVNGCLMDYVVSLSDEPSTKAPANIHGLAQATASRPDVTGSGRTSLKSMSEPEVTRRSSEVQHGRSASTATAGAVGAATTVTTTPKSQSGLDYGAAVSSLTLLFLNDHEATRVAAMTWLIMLHRKAPQKVLAYGDGIFPALLKTLSDPSDTVVTKDLQLLSQIARTSEEAYFNTFMVNLLSLFSTDRKLLETRGNLIIRQLSLNLSPERIYRTMAECIEREEDLEFASIMVQNLNNNLITAPQLADMRKRLRNLDSRARDGLTHPFSYLKDGQTLFVTLFRSWCYNAVATFSLCLLAQAYEQAYHLLQIFGELDMTVNLLIQVDKLVQLIESPVFTCKALLPHLRLQLLEPEKYPYLYKCMYGILMLLPQSSAFAALKNRLNSVSSIGYLHMAPKSTSMTSSTSSYDRPNRLKSRDDNAIRWVDLLEKFRSVQERARRAQNQDAEGDTIPPLGVSELRIGDGALDGRDKDGRGYGANTPVLAPKEAAPTPAPAPKRSGLGRQFGRLGGAVSGKNRR